MKLEAQAVTVRRAGRNIVDAVSLAAEGGELVGIIGANGAGKSTLLSVLAGLLRPDAGRVLLDARPLGEIPARELARRRAYLPQNPRCEWPISVERLVALGLTPSLPAIGALPASYRTQIEAALAMCDLTDRRDQAATTLSGGELARAMLARALVGDPQLLIIDEPIAGLDPRHALDTIRRLRLLSDAGKLVVAALHDLTLAARYATRIVALHNGRIVADGPTGPTLTAGLLREIFEVVASITGSGARSFVDFVLPADGTR
jgi:iron complex transport system ATP-binding protein